MTHRNLVEMHRVQAERLGPAVALRYKRHGMYRDLSWAEYRAAVEACAAALIDAGIKPGDRVGLFAENRVEWLIADLGILAAGAVCVSPHAPLTAKQVQYELADSGACWVFVSTPTQLDKVLQVRADLPELRGIVAFDPFPDAPEGVVTWRAFLGRGRARLGSLREELARREAALDGASLAALMYTSGTTGKPKGVMLTHGNLVSNSLGVLQVCANRPGDVLLGWLPLSHIYARTVDHYRTTAAGVVLALAESAETLVLNLAEIQPTHMNAVPRFYEKIYTAFASDDPAKTSRRLRDVFGPRLDFLSSGGAPLPPPIAKAFHDAGLLVLQGYGLTESSPVISFNHKEGYKLETVGRPLPGVEVRIADDGEVLTRGPHVMKGYWNNPKATAETIRDGWLHTGDLGTLDADGFLSITGRKKELMVMSSGKKLVPSYIEGLLVGDSCIDQAIVVGEGRNYLTALIVPDWKNLRATLREAGLSADGDEELLARHPAVYALLEMRIAAALADVSSWEQVKKFTVLAKPFSVAADEMTVSLKLRRNVILEHNAERIKALYQ